MTLNMLISTAVVTQQPNQATPHGAAVVHILKTLPFTLSSCILN